MNQAMNQRGIPYRSPMLALAFAAAIVAACSAAGTEEPIPANTKNDGGTKAPASGGTAGSGTSAGATTAGSSALPAREASC